MSEHGPKLSTGRSWRAFTFELDYTPEDGWTGHAVKPASFDCEVSGDTAEETCEAAWRRVEAHFGIDCSVSYRYSDRAMEKASREDEENPAVVADRLACPLCNTEHPGHAAAMLRAHARLN